MSKSSQEAKVSATSPAVAAEETSFWGSMISGFSFLPDFTEHPKPKRRKTLKEGTTMPIDVSLTEGGEGEVSFMSDFIAGGCAGCASVIVGHPFDTIKVRMQTSKSASSGLFSTLAEFGGPASLFRGMAAPLGSAAVINAIVFSSYGVGSRLYDEYLVEPVETDQNHDPWQKAWACGSFAGLVQCLVICPMEHVKCRLQVQHGKGSPDNIFKGPVQATKGIVQQHGVSRLYTGWWTTIWREVPAFGLYFASYDYLKDRANSYLSKMDGLDDNPTFPQHTHTWIASAFAGGCAGSITWAIVYPIDVIKTRVQTAPLDTPRSQLSMMHIGKAIVAQHGWRYLFRGLGITLLRAFPVNGTIFPVYEFALKQINNYTGNSSSTSL